MASWAVEAARRVVAVVAGSAEVVRNRAHSARARKRRRDMVGGKGLISRPVLWVEGMVGCNCRRWRAVEGGII